MKDCCWDVKNQIKQTKSLDWPDINSYKLLITLSLLTATYVSAKNHYKPVWNKIRLDKTSILIWIQTVLHSESVPERTQKLILKKVYRWQKKHEKYPVCKELKFFRVCCLIVLLKPRVTLQCLYIPFPGIHDSYRQVWVKFKDFSRTSKRLSYSFQGLKVYEKHRFKC